MAEPLAAALAFLRQSAQGCGFLSLFPPSLLCERRFQPRRLISVASARAPCPPRRYIYGKIRSHCGIVVVLNSETLPSPPMKQLKQLMQIVAGNHSTFCRIVNHRRIGVKSQGNAVICNNCIKKRTLRSVFNRKITVVRFQDPAWSIFVTAAFTLLPSALPSTAFTARAITLPISFIPDAPEETTISLIKGSSSSSSSCAGR